MDLQFAVETHVVNTMMHHLQRHKSSENLAKSPRVKHKKEYQPLDATEQQNSSSFQMLENYAALIRHHDHLRKGISNQIEFPVIDKSLDDNAFAMYYLLCIRMLERKASRVLAESDDNILSITHLPLDRETDRRKNVACDGYDVLALPPSSLSLESQGCALFDSNVLGTQDCNFKKREHFERLQQINVWTRYFSQATMNVILCVLTFLFLLLVVIKLNLPSWNPSVTPNTLLPEYTSATANKIVGADAHWCIPFSVLYLIHFLIALNIGVSLMRQCSHLANQAAKFRLVRKYLVQMKLILGWINTCLFCFFVLWHLRLTFPNYDRSSHSTPYDSMNPYLQASYVFGSGLITLSPLYLLSFSLCGLVLYMLFMLYANSFLSTVVLSEFLIAGLVVTGLGFLLSQVVLLLWLLKWELHNYVDHVYFNWSYVLIPCYLAALLTILAIIAFALIVAIQGELSKHEQKLFIVIPVCSVLILCLLIIWMILVSITTGGVWKYSYIALMPIPFLLWTLAFTLNKDILLPLVFDDVDKLVEQQDL